MAAITSAQASARAAEVLELADCEPNPAMVEAKVSIAAGWTELAATLAEMERA
jgi:hypothetical protein